MGFYANDTGSVDVPSIIKLPRSFTGPNQQIFSGGIVGTFARSLNVFPDIDAAVQLANFAGLGDEFYGAKLPSSCEGLCDFHNKTFCCLAIVPEIALS